jgi:hypothetical protein
MEVRSPQVGAGEVCTGEVRILEVASLVVVQEVAARKGSGDANPLDHDHCAQ